MKIKEITWLHRFDFCANLICEHCGHEQELKSGYNDSYYHDKVLPAFKCHSCGKNRSGEIDKPSSGSND